MVATRSGPLRIMVRRLQRTGSAYRVVIVLQDSHAPLACRIELAGRHAVGWLEGKSRTQKAAAPQLAQPNSIKVWSSNLQGQFAMVAALVDT